MACDEPNDPSLPLIGCCAQIDSEFLYVWNAGDSVLPSTQPFEPENFYRVTSVGLNPGRIPPWGFTLIPPQNTRWRFSFRGVWPAVPINIWESLTLAEVKAMLPFRTATSHPLIKLYDYRFALFLTAVGLPPVPLGASSFPVGITGVLINSIPGISFDSGTTYKWNRIIDIWRQPILDNASPPYNLVSLDELILGLTAVIGTPLRASLRTIRQDGLLVSVDRLNYGHSLDGLNLPGRPSVPDGFSKGVNVSFLNRYTSADATPLLITDVAPPSPLP